MLLAVGSSIKLDCECAQNDIVSYNEYSKHIIYNRLCGERIKSKFKKKEARTNMGNFYKQYTECPWELICAEWWICNLQGKHRQMRADIHWSNYIEIWQKQLKGKRQIESINYFTNHLWDKFCIMGAWTAT